MDKLIPMTVRAAQMGSFRLLVIKEEEKKNMNLRVGGGNRYRLDQGGVRGKIEDEYDHNVLDTYEILKE